jgi:hypothetical protein
MPIYACIRSGGGGHPRDRRVVPNPRSLCGEGGYLERGELVRAVISAVRAKGFSGPLPEKLTFFQSYTISPVSAGTHIFIGIK